MLSQSGGRLAEGLCKNNKLCNITAGRLARTKQRTAAQLVGTPLVIPGECASTTPVLAIRDEAPMPSDHPDISDLSGNSDSDNTCDSDSDSLNVFQSFRDHSAPLEILLVSIQTYIHDSLEAGERIIQGHLPDMYDLTYSSPSTPA